MKVGVQIFFFQTIVKCLLLKHLEFFLITLL